MISPSVIDRGMDTGEFTFVMDIPPDFQRDVLEGKSPSIQLNVDATRMSQAFVGSSYIQQMTMDEVNELIQNLMLIAPTTHFVAIGQAILFRGAGLSVVWPPMVALLVIGRTLFLIALNRIRKSISQMV
jgi:ABC-type multidrug transport system permease subunit